MPTYDSEVTWENVAARSRAEWEEHLATRVQHESPLPPVLELASWLQEHCGSRCLDDRNDAIAVAVRILELDWPGKG